MINGSFSDFKDILYYGGEILFEYEKNDYFIQGWTDDGLCTMVLDNLSQTDKKGYMWEYSCSKMIDCAERFLNDPIWNGKTFLEIQADVIWKDF